MANHAYAKTGKTLDPKEVDAHVRKIVTEKLHGLFNVEFNEEKKSWIIRYKGDKHLGFQFWISNDEKWEEGKDKPKIFSKDSVLEFRHQNTLIIWYIEGVLRENLGQTYSAMMFDDGCEIESKPNPERYETFEEFCTRGSSNKEEIKKLKNFYFPFWEKDIIPKELVDGLNLDFKIK